jgi:hypothetical protein
MFDFGQPFGQVRRRSQVQAVQSQGRKDGHRMSDERPRERDQNYLSSTPSYIRRLDYKVTNLEYQLKLLNEKLDKLLDNKEE